jgi:hypothetical protein
MEWGKLLLMVVVAFVCIWASNNVAVIGKVTG